MAFSITQNISLTDIIMATWCSGYSITAVLQPNSRQHILNHQTKPHWAKTKYSNTARDIQFYFKQFKITHLEERCIETGNIFPCPTSFNSDQRYSSLCAIFDLSTLICWSFFSKNLYGNVQYAASPVLSPEKGPAQYPQSLISLSLLSK